MLRIRKVKTASNKTAVQIVSRVGKTFKMVKHLGSAKNEDELKNLSLLANQLIRGKEKTKPLFPDFFESEKHNLVSMDNLKIVGHKHNFAYEFLSNYYKLCGLDSLKNKLLKDLVIIRVFEPVSKLQSIKLLNKYFGCFYTKNYLYKNLPTINKLKTGAEKIAVLYAKRHLSFDFTLVFFDVTTLYFETFKDDQEGFRKPGFSKDNKSNQPQILVSLVVTKEGFPISVNVFDGNKFEGHTILPVIERFREIHKIDNLTVVADAAMLSFNNIKGLINKNLNYIVGARISNLPIKLIQKISNSLSQKEGIYFQVKTGYGNLICDYSVKRASKDKSDRTKQITKAQDQIRSQNKFVKKLRFLKEVSRSKFELNTDLIKKDELLDGIKGYYTNLENIAPQLIISRYKDLWHIEKSFRIAKSDLLARPVFHHKKESIKAHILIVFVGLCLVKAIEIKTGKSIRKIKDEIWEILDNEIEDNLTKARYIKRDEY